MGLTRAIWTGFVIVVAAAALIVAVRVYAFVFDRSLFESFRPTMSELLDGQAANQERLAALGGISAVTRGLTVDGVTEVAEVTSTYCMEGQNNYKVHDGFRYSCIAESSSYFAWSGAYLDPARAIREKIGSRCPIPLTELDEISWQEPRPQTRYSGESYGGEFRCHSRTRLWITYLNTDGLTSLDTHLAQPRVSDSSRRVSGPTSEDLFESLSGYQWVAVVTTRQVYFEDEP